MNELYLGKIEYHGETIEVSYSYESETYLFRGSQLVDTFLGEYEGNNHNAHLLHSEGINFGHQYMIVLYCMKEELQYLIQRGREFIISFENPFNKKSIDIKTMSKRERILLLNQAIEKNKRLSQWEKDQLYQLNYYLKTAPCMDFKRLYELYRTVRMRQKDFLDNFSGTYDQSCNLLGYQEKEQFLLDHEKIHLLTNHKEKGSCGVQKNSEIGYKTTEGLADLISAEYYGYPLIDDLYYKVPALVISMLSEMIDPNLFHVANNTGNFNFVKNELRLIDPTLNPDRLFALTDFLSDLLETGINVDYSNLIYEILKMINQYCYANNNEYLKDNKVLATYGNMFLEDVEEGVFVPHFNEDLMERFPTPIFYKIGEDVEELIQFQKRKKVF